MLKKMEIKRVAMASCQPSGGEYFASHGSGSVYSLEELRRVLMSQKKRACWFTWTGARFANALLSLITPAQIDVRLRGYCVIGATEKRTMRGSDCGVHKTLSKEYRVSSRKRGGHLHSKMRLFIVAK